MTVLDIVRQVRGSLSLDACIQLDRLVRELPPHGTILDFCPGDGRSTVVMAVASQNYDKHAWIAAIDSHVTNPLASKPLEEGTLLPFLGNLRTFKCSSMVMPILGMPYSMDDLLNKKSANLVVIQIPSAHVDTIHALELSIVAAQNTIRRGGRIVVACSFIEKGLLDASLTKMFNKDYALLRDEAGLQVFEYQTKEKKA